MSTISKINKLNKLNSANSIKIDLDRGVVSKISNNEYKKNLYIKKTSVIQMNKYNNESPHIESLPMENRILLYENIRKYFPTASRRICELIAKVTMEYPTQEKFVRKILSIQIVANIHHFNNLDKKIKFEKSNIIQYTLSAYGSKYAKELKKIYDFVYETIRDKFSVELLPA